MRGFREMLRTVVGLSCPVSVVCGVRVPFSILDNDEFVMNNQDELFHPEGDTRATRPVSEKPSGGCGRSLLLLFAIAGGLSLLCCCGIGISIYSVVPRVDDDPVIARQVLQELITIDLPERYTPQMALRMNLFQLMQIRGVLVRGANEDDLLIIAKMKGSMAQDADVRTQIEQALRTESSEADTLLSSETRTFEISCQPVEFPFLKKQGQAAEVHREMVEQLGEQPAAENPDAPAPEEVPVAPEAPPTDPPAETPPAEVPAETPEAAPGEAAPEIQPQPIFYEVRAMLPATDGPLMFLLIVDEANWDEDEVVRMIESIQLP